MIGVVAPQAQHDVVREFFELFKTPWEFYREHADYEVLLCAGSSPVGDCSADLVIVYAGCELPLDSSLKFPVSERQTGPSILLREEMQLPIYKDYVTFASSPNPLLVDHKSRQAAAYVVERSNGSKLVRIGYDLFDEVAALLTDWQPVANAALPSLDFHIYLLRDVIVSSGISLLEIPPVPEGYSFIACLTHDVDHPSIRLHKFDHTMFGFLYRATVGTVVAVLRQRAPWRALFVNMLAAIKLPLVHLGLAKDYWSDLAAYGSLEGESRSSFFVIPFKRHPGLGLNGPSDSMRASGYGAADIAAELDRLNAAGYEIALHGIDSWHDSSNAHQEMEEIRRVANIHHMGIRMHWLYFDKASCAVLDQAGFDYDSTVGYNQAVGYRAGTTQVYKPLDASRLLELPLHVMDTALFSSGRQNLSSAEANKQVDAILDHAAELGGVVTINWHDRSIAPERLWDTFYAQLLSELNRRRAWLASAGDTVRWFRKRRSVTFDNLAFTSEGTVSSSFLPGTDDGLPNLCVRVHNARLPLKTAPTQTVST